MKGGGEDEKEKKERKERNARRSEKGLERGEREGGFGS